ncbi:MAG: hypothetical protein HGA44_05765 [Cellulomonadaceae bacterium]|nr:hypothetical protein [Cellulomonadaceae bacterium]
MRDAVTARLALTARRAVAGLAVAATLMTGAASTTAMFADSAQAELAVKATRWATSICVIWSNEARSDQVFTIVSNAPLGHEGWTNIVDKTAATSVSQLTGCDVVFIAGEAWWVEPGPHDLAVAWFTAGGRVLSTGNDTSAALLPELIGARGSVVTDLPMGGSVPGTAAQRAALSPIYPTWTPGATGTYQLDGSATPVTVAAAGAACVGTVKGHTEWCAAIARTNTAGGRWVHLHTKIGSLTAPGDVPAANAALTWLVTVGAA